MKNTLENLCNYDRHGIAYGSDCTLRLSSWYMDDEKNSIDYIGDRNVEIIGRVIQEWYKEVMLNIERFIAKVQSINPALIDAKLIKELIDIKNLLAAT